MCNPQIKQVYSTFDHVYTTVKVVVVSPVEQPQFKCCEIILAVLLQFIPVVLISGVMFLQSIGDFILTQYVGVHLQKALYIIKNF